MNLHDEVLDARPVASNAESDVGRQRERRSVVRPCEQRRAPGATIAVRTAIPVYICARVSTARKKRRRHRFVVSLCLPVRIVGLGWNVGASAQDHVVSPLGGALHAETRDVINLVLVEFEGGANVGVVLFAEMIRA